MRTVFMGTPGFAVPVLETLLSMGHTVVGVYTQPDKPAGRGRRLEASPVKAYAQARSLSVFQPRTFRDPAAVEELRELHPDLVVVAAYGKLLPPQVLEVPPHGCVNIHPSLLPRHRGPSPVVTAILEADHETGVTLMLMDEGMDSGPLIAQHPEPVLPEDTTPVLTERLMRAGADLLREKVPAYLAGQVQPRPQDHDLATYSRMVRREDGELRWEEEAEVLARQVRAYIPWPGSYTTWGGRLLKVTGACLVDGGHDYPPGKVVALDAEDAPVGVVTGRGVLGLRQLQLEGGRPMSAAEFRRGHPQFISSSLPS